MNHQASLLLRVLQAAALATGCSLAGAAPLQLAGGEYHSMLLSPSGTLYAWGHNRYGQVGDGTVPELPELTPGINNRPLPQRIGDAGFWRSIAAGATHSLGVAGDGTLWTWGYCFWGQLGNGRVDCDDVVAPAPVGTDTDWIAVAGGEYHSIGLRSDGSLWGWGGTFYGQAGSGPGAPYRISQPQPVGTDRDWVAIGSGKRHNLALKADGTLWGWGYNAFGQVGDGSRYMRYAPVQVDSSRLWEKFSAGGGHSLAIARDGTLWAWGYGKFGQLGRGDRLSSPQPSMVGQDTDWTEVAAGGYHGVALKADGSLWAWGRNEYGQVGNGTTEDVLSPVRIGDRNDWIAVGAGDEFSLAVRADGTVWAWGKNIFGALGNGSLVDSPVPVQVAL